MTTVQMIDDIYVKMQTTPLSFILPMLSPLALECCDYDGFCILYYWGRPFSTDDKSYKFFRSEIEKALSSEGLSHDNIIKIEENALQRYIDLRTISKGQVMMSSAREMEDKINAFNDMLVATNVPQGLHPVDLYERSNTEKKEKLIIIENRQKIEHQYAVLQSYISSKLAEYRRVASLKEKKETMEKRIVNSKKVFIIHGHNEAKRRELKDLLENRFGLEVVILSEQPDQGLTIIEKFEKFAANCSYAFALFTPDDIVTNGSTQYFQARPNVIFELGWFYANLGRARVCILDQASEESRIFSDLQGVMRIQFTNSINEKYIEIERELKTGGIIN